MQGLEYPGSGVFMTGRGKVDSILENSWHMHTRPLLVPVGSNFKTLKMGAMFVRMEHAFFFACAG